MSRQAPPDPPPKRGILSDIVPHFAIGANKYVALPIAGISQIAGDITGSKSLTDLGNNMAENATAYIAGKEKDSPTQKFQDISSVGDAARWGVQQVSEMAPQIVSGMVAGGAGGAAGKALAPVLSRSGIVSAETLAGLGGKEAAGIAGEYGAEKGAQAALALRGAQVAQIANPLAMESSMIYQGMKDGEKDPYRALAYGALAALPDIVVPGYVMEKTGAYKAFPGMKKMFDETPLLGSGKQLTTGQRISDVGKTVATATLGGTGTEALQTIIERVGSRDNLQSDEAKKNGFWKTVYDKGLKAAVHPEAWDDIVESSASGGLMGFLEAVGGHGLGHLAEAHQQSLAKKQLDTNSQAPGNPAEEGALPAPEQVPPPPASVAEQTSPMATGDTVSNAVLQDSNPEPSPSGPMSKALAAAGISVPGSESPALPAISVVAESTELEKAKTWANQQVQAGQTQLMQNKGVSDETHAARILAEYRKATQPSSLIPHQESDNAITNLLPEVQDQGPGEMGRPAVGLPAVQTEISGVGSNNIQSGGIAHDLSNVQKEVNGSQEKVPAVRSEDVTAVKTQIQSIRDEAHKLQNKKTVFQNGQSSVVSATEKDIKKAQKLFSDANTLEDHWYAALYPEKMTSADIREAINQGMPVLESQVSHASPVPHTSPKATTVTNRTANPRRKLDSSKDSLSVAIAKMGGINRAEIDKQTGNGKDLAHTLNSLATKEAKAGILHVISSKGIPLDTMRGALVENGYLNESADINTLLDKLDSASRGTVHRSTHSTEAGSDAYGEAEARYSEMIDAMTDDEYAEFSKNQWLDEQVQELADASDILDDYLDGMDTETMTAADWQEVENDLKEALDATEFSQGNSAEDQGQVQQDAAGKAESVSPVSESDVAGKGTEGTEKVTAVKKAPVKKKNATKDKPASTGDTYIDQFRASVTAAKARGENINDSGVYLDIEDIPVPYSKSIKRKDTIRIAQDADGKFRSSADGRRTVGDMEGFGSAPSIRSYQYDTKEAAINAAGDYIRNRIIGKDPAAAKELDAFTERLVSGSTAKAEAIKSNQVPPTTYGATNTLVTIDRAAEIRAKLKAKFDSQVNSGIDPEMLALGTELAIFHIEAGVRKFTAFAAAIAQDLDVPVHRLREYLRGWYNGARDTIEDKGLSIDGMDDSAVVREAHKALFEVKKTQTSTETPERSPERKSIHQQRLENYLAAAKTEQGKATWMKKIDALKQKEKQQSSEQPSVTAIPENWQSLDNKPEPTFRKGDRFQTKDGQHGEISDIHSYIVSTGMIYPGRTTIPTKEHRHMYTGKLDNGVVQSLYDFQPETDPAPEVVPAPLFNGKPADPQRLLDDIKSSKDSAANKRAAASRAKKAASIKEHTDAATVYAKKAADQQAAFDTWATKYPAEAIKYQKTAEIVTVPSATESTGSEKAPAGKLKMDIKETVHTKKGHKLFIVKMYDRVERDEYDKLNRDAKRTGNGWDKWSKGFQFLDRESAESFVEKWAGTKAEPAPSVVKPKVNYADFMTNVYHTLEENGWLHEAARNSSRDAFVAAYEDAYKKAAYAEVKTEVAKGNDVKESYESALKNSLPELADRFRDRAKSNKPSINELTANQQKTIRDLGPVGTKVQFVTGFNKDIFEIDSIEPIYGKVHVRDDNKNIYRNASEYAAIAEKPLASPTGSGTMVNEKTPTKGASDGLRGNVENAATVREPAGTATASERGNSAGSNAGSPEHVQPAGSRHSAGDDTKPAGKPVISGTGTKTEHGGNDSARDSVKRHDGILEVMPVNYRITDADKLGKGGAKQKARDNIAAIKILKQITQEERGATPEEQAQLVAYVGWGASELANGMFENTGFNPATRGYSSSWFKEGWEDLGKELKRLLSPEEYAAAQKSTVSAYYTPAGIVDGMYSALEQMGFTGGRILDPGTGVGHFIGKLPDTFLASTRVTGVELDDTSAAIAKLLYPGHDIRHQGFEKFVMPDGFYDVAVGNPPFVDLDVTSDPAYARHKFKLHDYFFAKSIDKVRPGGLLMFITSKGTMDKANDKARAYLAERADLLGAIRLPETAFRENAGTDTVTDVIFLRKRGPGEDSTGKSWNTLKEVMTPDGATHINEYFADNPHMVLGTNAITSSQFGPKYTVLPHNDHISLAGQFQIAVKDNLPRDVYRKNKVESPADRPTVEYDLAPNTIKEGAFFLDKSGAVMSKENGVGVPSTKNSKDVEVIKSFIPLRDAVRQVLYVQIKGGDLATAQKDLKKQYDSFVRKHGIINNEKRIVTMRGDKESVSVRTPNFSPFRDDPDAYLVASIERYDDNTNSATPGPIFTERTIKPEVVPQINSITDALHVVMHESGMVDIAKIAGHMNVTEAQAIDALETAVYHNPQTMQWETDDEYLSGNVKQKLVLAENSAQADPSFQRNVEALKAVQPQDLPPSRMSIGLGEPIVKPEHIEKFAKDVISMGIKVAHLKSSGGWGVEKVSGYQTPDATSDWGTARRNAAQLIDDALNSRQIRIESYVMVDGEEKKVFDKDATNAANEKLAKIKERFAEWVWEHPGRSEELARAYNDAYNNSVKRVYGGDHINKMTFPGMSAVVNPFEHQKRVAWRVVQSGNTYMAHSVGAGKAQPLDAKILTPTGWKFMGDIAVEDSVIAGDGTVTRVIGVYPQGEKEIYRVEFSDGSSTECCDEHLWLTMTYAARSAKTDSKRLGKTWKSAEPQVRQLSEIRESLLSDHLNAKNHSIPIVGKVEFKKQKHEISPYILGVLLGDGDIGYDRIRITTGDREIINTVTKLLPGTSMMKAVKQPERCPTWAINGNTDNGTNPFIRSLKSMGLQGTKSHTKFIPEQYKFDSIRNRSELLKGLLDTDGSMSKNGSVYFYTVSERLADDVVFLVQSLGGIVNRKTKTPKFVYNGIQKTGKLCHVLCICLPNDIVPFTLSRKIERYRPKSKYLPVRYITNIVPAGNKPAQCIMVEHSSHLYVTDDFIVTHNTIGSILAGMELKRLGIKKKPMWAVPNHMLKQFASEFLQLYPAAKIMVADENQFSKENRNRFMGRVAAENWDGIIITHSAFGKMQVSPEFSSQFIRDQIDELDWELQSTDKSERLKRKQIEQAKARLEQRLEKVLSAADKDKGVTFEETGIDQLFVDEAHEFRKLDFTTNQTNIKGIDPNGSLMAFDLYVKSRYLEKLYPGRSLVLMSGTAITNTIGEIYTIQRFLQEDKLKELGLDNFDAWSSTFGDLVTKLEATPAGNYKPVTRFAKFKKLASLSQLWSEVGDFIHARDLTYITRPSVKSGGRILVTSEQSPVQQAYKRTLADRIKAIERRKRPPQKGDDILLSVITDGRHAALDERYISSGPPSKDNKLEKMTGKVAEIWQDTSKDKLTQMIFVDLGMPGSEERRGFSAYNRIVESLVAQGIPANEIAIMQNYKKSDEKQKLFRAMNDGTVRVLIGSSEAMGTGVNAQKKLVALHHLDPDTYLPSNIEQREGRIVRQGNSNAVVQLYAYVTKGSYDETMWQFLETKQRFIDQFLSGDAAVDEATDIDGGADSFAMARAMSSDNPLILERAGIEADIQRLESLRRAHFDDQQRLNMNASWAEQNIPRYRKEAAALENVIARRTDTAGDKFTLTLAGTTFDERKKAGEAISTAIDKMLVSGKEQEWNKIGEVAGLDIMARGGISLKIPWVSLEIGANGTYSSPISFQGLESTESIDPVGVAMKLENMARSFDRHLADIVELIAKDEKTLKDSASRIGRAFEHTETLADKHKRLNEIETVLKAEEQKSDAGSTPDDAARFKLTDSPAPGIDAVEAQAWADTLPIAKRVNIVQSVDDLPVNARAEITNAQVNPARVQAMELHGIIHVIADNVPDLQRVKALVIGHELAHAGQTEKIVNVAVDWFRRTRDGKTEQAKTAHAMLQRIADIYGYDLEDTNDFRRAVQEATAAIAEQVADGTLKPVGLIQRLFMYIKHWLRQAGLISHVSDEELSLAVAEMLRLGEERLSVGLGGSEAQFAAAWHGSPHDHNGFSTAHIGTGEGAQTYGYGLYFAGNKEVAEYYRDNIRKESASELGRIIKEYSPAAYNKLDKATRTNEFYGTGDSAIGYLVQNINSAGTHRALGEDWKTVADAIKSMPGSGKLYQVELAPKEDEYLLWDKPLDQQSDKISSALKSIPDNLFLIADDMIGHSQNAPMNGLDPDYMGSTLYNLFTNMESREGVISDFGNLEDISNAKQAVSEYLNSLGIRGIKYLDGSSRGKGEGNYNYVIFNDADVEIKAKFALSPAITSVTNTAKETFGDNFTEGMGKGIGQTLNPLDFSRTRRWFESVAPDSVKNAMGWLFANPVYQAERDAHKQPFVEAGIQREEDKIGFQLAFMGWDGSTKESSFAGRLKDTFGKWQNPDKATAWGKIQANNAALSGVEQRAVNALLVEGDRQSRVYAGLEKAMMNPRIAAAKPTEAAFAVYKAVRYHIDTVVATERERIFIDMARKAGVEEETIKRHITDYRQSLSERPGWLPRNHGEGKHQVNVYHVVDGLEFNVKDVTTDGHGDNSSQAYLPYYAGPQATDMLTTIVKVINEKYDSNNKEKRLKFGAFINGKALMANGQMIITGSKQDVAEFLKLAKGVVPTVIEKNKQHLVDLRIDRKNKEADGASKAELRELDAQIKAATDTRVRVKVFMQLHESQSRAEKALADVRKNMKTAMPVNFRQGDTYESEYRVADGMTESAYGDLAGDFAMERAQMEALKRATQSGEISREEAAKLRNNIIKSSAEVLMGRGAGRHQIQRAPYMIEGYDTENALQLYDDYMTSTAGMLSKALYAREQFENFRYAAPEVKVWAEQYIRDTLRNMGLADRISGNARSIATFMYLGGKISSILVNGTQVWTLGVAELGRRTKQNSIKTIGTAQLDIIKGNLSADEKELFRSKIWKLQEMETAVNEMAGAHEGTTGKISQIFHTLANKTMMPFQEMELMNRRTMILAAYRAGIADGKSTQEAIDFALDVNRKTNFEMSRANLPGWARNAAGRTVYALQSFVWNNWNWIYNRATSGEKEDMKALLKYAAMITLIGGASAAAGGDELDKLYRRVFGRSIKMDLQQWTRAHLKDYGFAGDRFNTFIWHGAIGAGGINISNSMRLNIPMSGFVTGESSAGEAAMGVWSGMLDKGQKTLAYAAKGQIGRAAESAAPEALASPLKAYRMATQGATTSHGKPVFDEHGRPVKYSAGEAAVRALGFQPLEQSQRAETANSLQKISTIWNEQRQEVLDNLRRGTATATDVMKFNIDLRKSQAFPKVGIISADTIRSARTIKPDKKSVQQQIKQS